MTNRLRMERSTETPMDFEFTNRSRTKPVWATGEEDPHTPRKRTFADVNPSTPTLSTPGTPTWPHFGQNNNLPFLFQQPPPQTPHSPAWVPPTNCSPTKPTSASEPEIHDVSMSDASPGGPSPEKETEEERERTMAVGALRRVFNKRKGRGRSRLGQRYARADDEESSGEESGEDEIHRPLTQKTTNHYTLNVAGPAVPQSDTPYRLLGYVQVVFNGSLAAIALYLLVQFLFILQRDVEDRVSEYSMEIVQEIAQCQMDYKANLCAEGRIPAMQAQCAAWEMCMNRDPTKVGRAKISFEVFGELVNTFVEQISWKTLAFTITSLAFFAFFINSVLLLFRSRVNPATTMPPTHMPHYPIPPALPYAPQGYLPAPQGWQDKWKPSDDTEENPTRRRRLEDGQAAKLK
ncbi:Di-sulfide bridge nucleocytoplasmic transport domain-containing protein [Daedaleopsis nitida]|nr:Di-sulfide bridge nucleocytoplasmic transport domain-containing protein [Daedaleopsis nitida]